MHVLPFNCFSRNWRPLRASRRSILPSSCGSWTVLWPKGRPREQQQRHLSLPSYPCFRLPLKPLLHHMTMRLAGGSQILRFRSLPTLLRVQCKILRLTRRPCSLSSPEDSKFMFRSSHSSTHHINYDHLKNRSRHMDIPVLYLHLLHIGRHFWSFKFKFLRHESPQRTTIEQPVDLESILFSSFLSSIQFSMF